MASASPCSNSSTPGCRSCASYVTSACQSCACRARWSPSAADAPSTPNRRSRSGFAAISVSSTDRRAVRSGCASSSRTRPSSARLGSAVAPSASSSTGSFRTADSSPLSSSRSAALGSVKPCRSSRENVVLLRPGAVIQASRRIKPARPLTRSPDSIDQGRTGLSLTGEPGRSAGRRGSGFGGDEKFHAAPAGAAHRCRCPDGATFSMSTATLPRWMTRRTAGTARYGVVREGRCCRRRRW